MISSGPTHITDGIISFREITPEDSDLLYRWRFLHEPTRSMFRTTAVVSPEQHQKTMDRYFEAANTDRWFIVEHQGIPVGTISLVNMSEDGTEYDWGRAVIDPERRGLGLGGRTYALLLEYCRALGLHRVYGEILEQNEIVYRILLGLGFRQFGSYVHEGRRLLQFERDPREP